MNDGNGSVNATGIASGGNTNEMWRQIFDVAEQLGGFEPQLVDLKQRLERAKEVGEIPQDWLLSVKSVLSNEAVADLTNRLSELSNLYLRRKELKYAMRTSSLALVLSTLVRGPESIETREIALQLDEMQKKMKKYRSQTFNQLAKQGKVTVSNIRSLSSLKEPD